eukprot:CAMPEP_0184662430 /NCGR_PEP_ID=MMETSP0308-20130426/43231_1 /TAXON_ID=38269 /ORGANISM="Gloeochaete witrockiana, Strain SAG 46.84" /LENGTH=57 /DNA_ID=CAMNT_0027104457 /DNA_START=878 /DNA_END=1051 /DNA_ORIENTATION=-
MDKAHSDEKASAEAFEDPLEKTKYGVFPKDSTKQFLQKQQQEVQQAVKEPPLGGLNL